MNSLGIVAQIVGLVLCTAILAKAEPAINRMGRDTPLLIRIAFVLLAVSAVAGILAILSGAVPEWHTLLLAAGIATLLACERRVRLMTRTRDNGAHHAQG